MTLPGLFRAILRSGGVALVIATGFPAFLWFLGANGWHRDEAKSQWMQWMSRRFLKLLHCTVEVAGKVPQHGLIVCNHLSYVDILVIGSVCPGFFVAKSDVRTWPVFGWLATLSGTIFIRRKLSLTIPQQLDTIARPLAAGFPVVIFPEGTSSDGSQVLPFRSSFLEAARLAECAVIPSAIRYDEETGTGAGEVCYWGDMVLVPHMFNLLAKKSIKANLRFANGHPFVGDRKSAAKTLRVKVIALAHLGSPAADSE